MRVAYVVSRFPELSQTFVVRELDAVSEAGVEIELCSLFRPIDPTLHPAARAWAARVQRPSAPEAARSLVWWLRRRPLRLLATFATVLVGHARNPGVLVRAMATFALALTHARRFQGQGVDRVHAHFATYPALTAWVCRRLTALPYSFTAHAHDIFTHQTFLSRKVREADFVVSISEFNRDFLLHKLKKPETPVHVVHCGVDSSRYRPRAPQKAPEGAVRAVCVARLEPKKGHAVLLDALADGWPELGRIQLELIGDGPLRSELESQVERLGLLERVRFQGSLPEDEVTRALERADLFLLASIRTPDGEMEGIPVSLMEALAAGLPTVTTRLSGVPELVRDGVTGLLAEPGAPKELAAAIGRMLADPPAAARMGDEGRQLVAAEFDIRVSGERMAELFRAGSPAAR